MSALKPAGSHGGQGRAESVFEPMSTRAASAQRHPARGIGPIRSDDGRIESEGGDRPHVTAKAEEPNNALCPRGGLTPLDEKHGALSGHPTSDAAVWGHSPDEPV